MKSKYLVSKIVSILMAIVVLTASTLVPAVLAAPGLNGPPVAYDQTISTNENTQLNINLTASDPEGDSLTFSIVTTPANGTLSGTLPNLIYTPNSNYNGLDSFTFIANDGRFASNIATVSITINPANMTGGGSVFNATMQVTHGFELNCNSSKTPNNLQVNWEKGNRFNLENLTLASCRDDPTIKPNPPAADFDTYEGKGTGRYKGVNGATAHWIFTDAGEPGINDSAMIRIWDSRGKLVLSVSGNLTKGNHQAHGQAVELVSIAVTPVNPTIALGKTQQFTATGTYSDSTTKDLTATATWSSSNTGVATIASGLATSVASGTTDITAASDGITSPVQTLTVTAAKLVSIAVRVEVFPFVLVYL